jgi:hypothetical protein
VRNEIKGIVVGLALLSAAYAILYFQHQTANGDPVTSNFLGDISTPIIAGGFGSFALGFKTRINGFFGTEHGPNKEESNNVVTVRNKKAPTWSTAEPPASSPKQSELNKAEAYVRVILSGFGGGLTFLYAGFQLLPVIPNATAPYWFLVPFTCLGAGLFLLFIGVYYTIKITQYQPSTAIEQTASPNAHYTHTYENEANTLQQRLAPTQAVEVIPRPVRPQVIIDLITQLSLFAEKWPHVWFDQVASGKFQDISSKLSQYEEELIEARTKAFRTVDLSTTIDMHVQEFGARVHKLAYTMTYLQAVGEFQTFGNQLVQDVNNKLIPEIEKEYPAQ